jgi:F0F1-type ATP synthase assembly protein I
MGSGGRGAVQIVSTAVGYPLGGIVIGFVLDKLFDTLPWITIGLMFTAFAGACIQVMRSNKSRAD